MLQGDVARHLPAIAQTQGEPMSRRGRSQRLRAQPRHHLGRPKIPGVWHDYRLTRDMQGSEQFRQLVATHGMAPASDQGQCRTAGGPGKLNLQPATMAIGMM